MYVLQSEETKWHISVFLLKNDRKQLLEGIGIRDRYKVEGIRDIPPLIQLSSYPYFFQTFEFSPMLMVIKNLNQNAVFNLSPAYQLITF